MEELEKVLGVDKVMVPPKITDGVEPIAARPDFSSDEEDVVDAEKVERKQVRKKKKNKKKKAKQLVYSGKYLKHFAFEQKIE